MLDCIYPINTKGFMELTNEEIVTRLLSAKEILRVKNQPFITDSVYNLGDFLKKIKELPSPYGEKYIFIK